MTNLTLTADEQKVVLDYANRLEKRSRYWRAVRWLAVGCFLFGLVLLFGFDWAGEKLRSTMELPREALKISDAGGAQAVEKSLERLATRVDGQIAVLRAEFYLALKVLVVAGIGTGLFLYAASEWTRDQRDRLVVRLLRAAVPPQIQDTSVL